MNPMKTRFRLTSRGMPRRQVLLRGQDHRQTHQPSDHQPRRSPPDRRGQEPGRTPAGAQPPNRQGLPGRHRQRHCHPHLAGTPWTPSSPRSWGATSTAGRPPPRTRPSRLCCRRVIIETPAELLLRAMQAGTVSTNVYLRRLHNFCVDMNWLPWPLIPKRQWPAVQFKEKRAITFEEHQQIIAAERNPERKALYQLCWHLGGSQGDIAALQGEDVDWTLGTVSFTRKKTGVPVIVHLGTEALEPLQGPARRGTALSVPLASARGRSRHRVRPALPAVGDSRRHAAQLPLRLGRAGEGRAVTPNDSPRKRWGTTARRCIAPTPNAP